MVIECIYGVHIKMYTNEVMGYNATEEMMKEWDALLRGGDDRMQLRE